MKGSRAPAPPRFIVKWNNGAWKLFDTHLYSDVDTFPLKRLADEAAFGSNAAARGARRG